MLNRNNPNAANQIPLDVSENALVARAQQGEHQAFEMLYERYSTRIARHITSIVNDNGVGSELMQDTFIKAWEKLVGLRDPSCFSAWLYRIATNKAYNYQKRIKRIQQVSWEAQKEEMMALSAFDLEHQVEEKELVQTALARMRPTYRSCVLLYFERVPRESISAILGIKISSIDKYLSRGKKEFCRMYAQTLNCQPLDFGEKIL